MDGGLGVDIASMPVIMRMFTYLFRPLFFDVGGLFGVIIGIENLILLIAALAGFYFFFKGYQSSLPLFSRLFLVIYSIAMWFLLGNITANLGIALRQKWMFLPMILILSLSYISGSPVRKRIAEIGR